MANYECTVRTNYFHVKDEEAFRKLVEGIVSEYGRFFIRSFSLALRKMTPLSSLLRVMKICGM